MKIAFVLKQSIGPGGLTLKREKQLKKKTTEGRLLGASVFHASISMTKGEPPYILCICQTYKATGGLARNSNHNIPSADKAGSRETNSSLRGTIKDA